MSSMSWNDIDVDTDSNDYYQILGVSHNATQHQITTAYRKMAKTLHPDKNPDDPEGATSRFQDIVKIYEVLKDEKRRTIYDQFGEKGLQQTGFQFKCDPNILEDLFAAAFADDDDKEDDHKDGDILATKTVNVTLKELYHGTKKIINYKYKYKCKNCSGKGQIKNEIVKECSACNHTGKCQTPGYIDITCGDCQGSGIIFAPTQCHKCNGLGTYSYFCTHCGDCNGTGQLSRFKCVDCYGKGTQKKRNPNRRFSYMHVECVTCAGERTTDQTKCTSCKGNGKKKEFHYYTQTCKQCKGKAFTAYSQTLTCELCYGCGEFCGENAATCNVEAGTNPNDTLKVKHVDHNKGVYGIVLVEVNYIEGDAPEFVRSGADNNNLVMRKTISLRQALQGGNFIIDHVSGTKLSVQCNYDMLQMNSTKKIVGKGMPVKGVKGQYGDLFITFKIKMPKQLNQYHIKQICELLPEDNDSCIGDCGEMVQLSKLSGFDDMELNATRDRRQKHSNSDESKTNVECKQM